MKNVLSDFPHTHPEISNHKYLYWKIWMGRLVIHCYIWRLQESFRKWSTHWIIFFEPFQEQQEEKVSTDWLIELSKHRLAPSNETSQLQGHSIHKGKYRIWGKVKISQFLCYVCLLSERNWCPNDYCSVTDGRKELQIILNKGRIKAHLANLNKVRSPGWITRTWKDVKEMVAQLLPSFLENWWHPPKVEGNKRCPSFQKSKEYVGLKEFQSQLAWLNRFLTAYLWSLR